jgi:hypothetical protein
MAAQALLAAYVDLHGRRLSAAVAESAAAKDWAEPREPRAPRPVCAQLLQLLAEARDEVAQLVDDSVAASASGEPASHQTARAMRRSRF